MKVYLVGGKFLADGVIYDIVYFVNCSWVDIRWQ